MSDSTTPPEHKRFAIMRLGKIGSMTVLRHVSDHNTRAVMSENVEQDGPPPVELLDDGSDDFVASARARMAELGIDPASANGKIIAVEAVVSASRGWFAQASAADRTAWQEASVAWARQLFGRGLLTAKLHRDEEVPHIHFVALPVVEKKRLRRGRKPRDEEARRRREEEDARAPLVWTLAYHDILGGKSDRLSQEQDAYHGFVRHLGLERGEKQREATEIAMGDELSIQVGALARGVDADGNPRPRRYLTPKQYRARIRQLEADAAAARAGADRDRADAAADRDAAAAARRSADEQHDAATTTRAAADAHARALAEDRHALDLERAGLARRDTELVRRERQVQDADDALRVARADLQRRQDDLTVASAAAARATAIARDEAVAAAKARTAAEADRDATARLVAQAEADRSAVAGERARREAELALLMRASDDRHGLHLRPVDSGIMMNEGAMTEAERATYRREWPMPVRVLALTLAKALEHVRELARRLREREERLKADEVAVRRQEQANAHDLKQRRAAQLAEHERALAALKVREDAIKASVTAAERRVAAADARMKTAMEKEKVAATAMSMQEHWTKAVDMIGHYPTILIHGDDGSFRIDRRPERTGQLPDWLVATLQQQPPAWATAAIRRIHQLDMATERVEARERDAAHHLEQLRDMIDSVGSVLQPAQQRVVEQATGMVRRVGPALHQRNQGHGVG